MPHAIIRQENGRRHEVDFGDTPVRVEIHASEETVEISSRRISIRCRKNVGVSRFSTFPATCLAKLPPQRRDVPQALSCILGVTSDVGTADYWSATAGRDFHPMLRGGHLRHRLSAWCLWQHRKVLKRNRTDARAVYGLERSNRLSPDPIVRLRKPRFPPPGFLRVSVACRSTPYLHPDRTDALGDSKKLGSAYPCQRSLPFRRAANPGSKPATC
jgi:hypothetical protein